MPMAVYTYTPDAHRSVTWRCALERDTFRRAWVLRFGGGPKFTCEQHEG